MNTLIAGDISVLDFLYFSAIFVLSMVVFHNRQTRLGKKLFYVWWLIFVAVWLSAIISQRSLATKVFISLLLFSAAVVQWAIEAHRTQKGISQD